MAKKSKKYTPKGPKRKADNIGRYIPLIGPLLIRERKKREDLNGPFLSPVTSPYWKSRKSK